MKHWTVMSALAALVVGLSLAGCVDPTLVGEDLLDDDRISIDYTDTLALEAQTVRLDSALVYLPGSIVVENYLFGRYDDPIFGETEASIYLRPRLQVSPLDPTTVVRPNFNGATLDSIVLVLPLDTSDNYGPVEDATFGMDVLELTEMLPFNKVMYSDTTFATGGQIVSQTFQPSFDSTLVSGIEIGTISDSLRRPHVRIALSQEYGNRLLQLDTNSYKRDSLFAEVFRGLQLVPSQPSVGLLDFDLLEDYAGVYVYYHNATTDSLGYIFPLTARISHYEHDYTGSTVAPYLNNPSGDSLVFVQGTAGLMARIDLNDLEPLRGQIINQAVLEVPVRYLPGDDPDDYPVPEQLVLLYPTEDGRLQLLADIQLAVPNFSILFGGRPVTKNGQTVYRMDLSVHLQYVLDQEEDIPPVLYIASSRVVTAGTGLFTLGDRANRVVLAGPNAAHTPMRLKIAFTRL